MSSSLPNIYVVSSRGKLQDRQATVAEWREEVRMVDCDLSCFVASCHVVAHLVTMYHACHVLSLCFVARGEYCLWATK
jgi:hypothetical protein